MQDIDFDELDRAVNSATQPTPDVPAVSTEEPAAAVVPVVPSTPAARRSSGRFMDVVHPSSDMRTAPTVTARPAARPQPAQPAATATEWPDPLDFHGFTGDELTAAAPAVTEPVAETPAVDVSSLESPFLTDAKVEKRPLGAFSPNETPYSELPTPAVQTTPEEDDELLMLEAPEEEKLLDDGIDEPTVAEIKDIEATPEPVPAPVEIEEPVGPTSITQQYKEHPSTIEQTSSAIYDTEATHRPLTHGPKRKSSILVIVWILALILIGAGIGAAVYFFVLPML